MVFFVAGGIALMLALPVILILGILVILALRHDDDADGNRAPAIYGSVIAYLALLTILFAGTGAVHALVDTSSGHTHADGRSSESIVVGGNPMMDDNGTYVGPGQMQRRLVRRSSNDDDAAAVTEAVGFLIAAAAAMALLAVHRRLFARRSGAAGAAARVHRAYLLVMCFTVAIIAVAAGAMALFEVYELIFAGAANVANRADVARELVPTAVLALGAAFLWRWHWGDLGLDLGRPAPEPPSVTPTDVP